MYIRIGWGKVKPGQWGSYVAAYRRVAKLDVKGLKERWLVHDIKDPDAGYSISLWESLEDMNAWAEGEHYRNEYAVALQPFWTGEFAINVCEVDHRDGSAKP